MPDLDLDLDLDEEDRADLEAMLRLALVGGYQDREELAEMALDTYDSLAEEEAQQLVDHLWAERLAEQAAWDGETDPERLARAFQALEEAEITAREDFTCCRTCGQAEIGGEARPGARGFVYFHQQGTESAAEGGGLMLYYGGFDGSAETSAVVGREVVAALVAVGLPTEWDGDPGSAIRVAPLDWRKRLVG
jgi:hypothetical protein